MSSHGRNSSQPMRVGIMSPNLLLNVDDHNAMYDDPNLPWRFDSIAKKASLLFDKIYLTHDLVVTCSILDSADDDNDKSQTLRYLIDEDLIFLPHDLGYSAGVQFINENLVG